MKRTLVSVTVPVYNEAENLSELHQRLTRVLKSLRKSYEIIYVDDGSRDATEAMLHELARKDPHVHALILSRNFGKEVAMTAGLDHAQGEFVVPIDADLQDPPELIPQMLELADRGYDVVYARRQVRKGESRFKTITANLFYKLINKVSHIEIPQNTGDFRVMRRRVVESLSRLRERKRFMKGLFTWVGFKQTEILYDRDPRFAGTTKWNFWKLWNFALEGITSFSSLPLRIWSYVGLGIALCSFLYGMVIIALVAIHGRDLPGYASLLVVVLFLGGIQLLTLGIIGEYIGRMFEEVKGRPLYFIRDTYHRKGDK